MDCVSPFRIKKNVDPILYPDGMEVPCGKCINCRVQKKREWSLRMLHEVTTHKESIFITLTYNDENIPPNDSLSKRHAQLFLKRLRKSIDHDEPGRRIRYFLVGEYGDTTERPHYHAIIYGLGINSYDKSLVIRSWPYCDWTPLRIQKSFGLAQPKSVQYIAGYIQKKLSGELADEEYVARGREPVFRLMSQGIGRDYADTHVTQITQQGHCTINGVKISLPRYYINRLGLDISDIQSTLLDQELDTIETIYGERISRDDAYRDGITIVEKEYQRSRHQKALNLTTKMSLRNPKL